MSAPLIAWRQKRRRSEPEVGIEAYTKLCAAVKSQPALRVDWRTGGSLSPAEAKEAVVLATQNMAQLVAGWDASEREAEILHPATRVLMLRSTPIAADGAPSSSEHAADVQGQSLGPDGALVGFASYRFVTQETIRVVYLLELHVDTWWRQNNLGSLLLDTVREIGRAGQRQGLMLSVHLTNEAALRFYRARGLEASPVSPSRCAPPAIAATAEYEILQCLWDADARLRMKARGDAARLFLAKRAADGAEPPPLTEREGPTDSAAEPAGATSITTAATGEATTPDARGPRGKTAVRTSPSTRVHTTPRKPQASQARRRQTSAASGVGRSAGVHPAGVKGRLDDWLLRSASDQQEP